MKMPTAEHKPDDDVICIDSDDSQLANANTSAQSKIVEIDRIIQEIAASVRAQIQRQIELENSSLNDKTEDDDDDDDDIEIVSEKISTKPKKHPQQVSIKVTAAIHEKLIEVNSKCIKENINYDIAKHLGDILGYPVHDIVVFPPPLLSPKKEDGFTNGHNGANSKTSVSSCSVTSYRETSNLSHSSSSSIADEKSPNRSWLNSSNCLTQTSDSASPCSSDKRSHESIPVSSFYSKSTPSQSKFHSRNSLPIFSKETNGVSNHFTTNHHRKSTELLPSSTKSESDSSDETKRRKEDLWSRLISKYGNGTESATAGTVNQRKSLATSKTDSLQDTSPTVEKKVDDKSTKRVSDDLWNRIVKKYKKSLELSNNVHEDSAENKNESNVLKPEPASGARGSLPNLCSGTTSPDRVSSGVKIFNGLPKKESVDFANDGPKSSLSPFSPRVDLFKNGRPTHGRMICRKRALNSTTSPTSAPVNKVPKTEELSTHVENGKDIEKVSSSETDDVGNDSFGKYASSRKKVLKKSGALFEDLKISSVVKTRSKSVPTRPQVARKRASKGPVKDNVRPAPDPEVPPNVNRVGREVLRSLEFVYSNSEEHCEPYLHINIFGELFANFRAIFNVKKLISAFSQNIEKNFLFDHWSISHISLTAACRLLASDKLCTNIFARALHQMSSLTRIVVDKSFIDRAVTHKTRGRPRGSRSLKQISRVDIKHADASPRKGDGLLSDAGIRLRPKYRFLIRTTRQKPLEVSEETKEEPPDEFDDQEPPVVMDGCRPVRKFAQNAPVPPRPGRKRPSDEDLDDTAAKKRFQHSKDSSKRGRICVADLPSFSLSGLSQTAPSSIGGWFSNKLIRLKNLSETLSNVQQAKRKSPLVSNSKRSKLRRDTKNGAIATVKIQNIPQFAILDLAEYCRTRNSDWRSVSSRQNGLFLDSPVSTRRQNSVGEMIKVAKKIESITSKGISKSKPKVTTHLLPPGWSRRISATTLREEFVRLSDGFSVMSINAAIRSELIRCQSAKNHARSLEKSRLYHC